MKIFFLGIPQSGRSSVAFSLAESNINDCGIIDALHGSDFSFRKQFPKEHTQKFQDEYQQALSLKTKESPNHCIDNVLDLINIYSDKKYILIDNIT